MSNARNLSKLFPLSSLVGLVANLVTLGNSQAAISAVAAQGPIPTGAVFDHALSTAPSGYLMCYGQSLPSGDTTTAALRAALIADGNPYGVAGADPRVPDARGRVVAGKDNMGGSAANRLTNSGTGASDVNGTTLGAAGGTDRHTLTVAQMPTHNHNLTAGTGSGSNNYIARDSPGNTSTYGDAIHNAGSSEAHPNVQPTIVLNKIIKL